MRTQNVFVTRSGFILNAAAARPPDDDVATMTRDQLQQLIDRMTASAVQTALQKLTADGKLRDASAGDVLEGSGPIYFDPPPGEALGLPPDLVSAPTGNRLAAAVLAVVPGPLPLRGLADGEQPAAGQNTIARLNRVMSAPRRAGGAQ